LQDEVLAKEHVGGSDAIASHQHLRQPDDVVAVGGGYW
jgi:hypothetical protein